MLMGHLTLFTEKRLHDLNSHEDTKITKIFLCERRELKVNVGMITQLIGSLKARGIESRTEYSRPGP